MKQIRYALLLGVLIYGSVFGIPDVLNAPGFVQWWTWTTRAVVCLLTVGALLYTFADLFERFMQPVLSILMVLAGWGLLVMLVPDASGRNFFNGPVLIILPAYVLRRLRFVYTTAVGWLIVEAFVPGEIVVSGTHVLQSYLGGRGDDERKFEVAGGRVGIAPATRATLMRRGVYGSWGGTRPGYRQRTGSAGADGQSA